MATDAPGYLGKAATWIIYINYTGNLGKAVTWIRLNIPGYIGKGCHRDNIKHTENLGKTVTEIRLDIPGDLGKTVTGAAQKPPGEKEIEEDVMQCSNKKVFHCSTQMKLPQVSL